MTSRVQRYAAKVVLVVTALTLGACSQYGVANRAISVNKGLEIANNRMLLLNAVRASKRYPMVFSDITQITTKDPVTGSLSLQVPFGGDAKSNFVLSPQLNLGSGTTLQISPMNKQSFTRGITTATSLETLNYYLRQGWPKEMLFHMFIRIMRFKNACDEALFNLAPNLRTEDLYCPSGDKKRGTTVWTNGPGSKLKDQKHFKEFQEALRRMIAQELVVRKLRTAKDPDWQETTLVETVERKQEDGKMTDRTETVTTTKEKGETTESSQLFLGFKLPKDQAETGFDCIRDKDDPQACYIEVEAAPLRSPEAMIFYMGELIETQLKSENHFVPTLGSKKRPILKVVNGRPSGGTAVKVSHEGETYAIPRADAGRSMSVMSLVTLIFGLQREADELPTTPTVTVVGQ